MHPDLAETLHRLEAEQSYTAYSGVASKAKKLGADADIPELRIAVLRNFTIEPLMPVIEGEAVRSGFRPVTHLGDYDTIARDALSAQGELGSFSPDVVIVAQWLETLSPDLATRFASLQPDDVDAEVGRIVEALAAYIGGIRSQTSSPVLINNFPLPVFAAMGILDAQSPSYLVGTVQEINRRLQDAAGDLADVYVVDFMSVLARVGSGSRGIDERSWFSGKAPLGRDALVPVGSEYGKFFRALRGRARKCLVLDCDNALWGGVVGEDGLDGIALGEDYPGSCFQAFQRECLNLHDRGVILALCSKNNEADVLEVFRDHPGMILREDNIAAHRINWEDKASNLIALADELNIGVDSLVFADDSAFECGLVRERLPEVAVLELSTAPSTFAGRLAAGGWFDTLSYSAEDRKRTQMYRADAERQQLQSGAGSLEEYLAGLDIVVEIAAVDDLTLPRVAQLTQKTNQFNLTTRRYTEGDIQAFASDDARDVTYIAVRDRVSSLGIVGVAITGYHAEVAAIDTFLLSCRALGRGVEDALLAHVVQQSRARGCRKVVGRHIPTAKNQQTESFFPDRGFASGEDGDEGTNWELVLAEGNVEFPAWVTLDSDHQEVPE